MFWHSTLMAMMCVALAAADEVHFTNCEFTDPEQSPATYSVMDYYLTGSNINSEPNQGNRCFPEGSGTVQWEGGDGVGCTFPTGVTFRATLNANAASAPDFSSVGSGSNGFNTYTCFKDDGHELYVDQNAKVCFSLYYCLEN